MCFVLKDPTIIRQPVNDNYNLNNDGMGMLAGKIDWLVKSNHQILSVVNALAHKLNQTLGQGNNFDIRSTRQPSDTIDLMNNLETMNLLHNIHRFVVESDGKAKQSDILQADQIQVIRDFVSAIESERRNTGRATPSMPESVNQVSVRFYTFLELSSNRSLN